MLVQKMSRPAEDPQGCRQLAVAGSRSAIQSQCDTCNPEAAGWVKRPRAFAARADCRNTGGVNIGKKRFEMICERARWLRRRRFSPVEHEQLLLQQIGELRLSAERKWSLQLIEFFVIKSDELTQFGFERSDRAAKRQRPASARPPRPTWCEYAAAKRKSALAVLRARTAASATHS